MVYKFFDKKTTSGGDVKNESMSNQELAKKLHKSIIRNLKMKRSPIFIDNICSVDLSNMQLISKFQGIYFFILC